MLVHNSCTWVSRQVHMNVHGGIYKYITAVHGCVNRYIVYRGMFMRAYMSVNIDIDGT